MELAKLRAPDTLDTGNEVKNRERLCGLCHSSLVLQKVKSKYGFYCLPTPIPAIVFSVAGVGLTELRATAQIKQAFISMQF